MATETPRLDTIAPELLRTILGFISEPDTAYGEEADVKVSRIRSLHALTMTSKHLRYEALPYLYQRFQPHLQPGKVSLALFTRSLCENPELVKHVQALDIASFTEKHFQVSTPEDTHILKAGLLRLRFLDHYDDIEASLEKNCSTALNLLLLSLVTKLGCVNIGFDTNIEPPLEPFGLPVGLWKNAECPCCRRFAEHVHGILTSPKLCHQYKNVKGISIGPRCASNMKLFAAVLRLPSIHCIAFNVLGDVSRSYEWKDMDLSSTVEQLYVQDSYLLAEDIAEILHRCKKLKSFHIEWTQHFLGEGTDWEVPPAIDASIVTTALQLHKEYLQELDLTDITGQSILSSQSGCKLSSLTALSSLNVDDVFLLGGETWANVDLALPHNLQKLKIRIEILSVSFFGDIWNAVGRARHPALIDLTLSLWNGAGHIAQEGFSQTRPDLMSKEFIGIDKGTREELYQWRYDTWRDDILGDFNMHFTGRELWRLLCFLQQRLEEQGGADFLVANQDSVIYVSQEP
ncbi:hypothetical protein KC318_g7855 [Hortaea werneckii]|nr:hypothetical protein KC334_g8058 [Hortaea werneckii]KAI7006233.1 hypothetical protein KC355_g7848 [Hortaea werneckii]KAI7664206.1 hypothetical protein KC318_g7855 [Hortaea werneckii]